MLACPQAAHETELAERLGAKRRRAALGDITNRPVTADDASSGSSSYAVCAHPPPCRTRPRLGRFGRALMPATALSRPRGSDDEARRIHPSTADQQSEKEKAIETLSKIDQIRNSGVTRSGYAAEMHVHFW